MPPEELHANAYVCANRVGHFVESSSSDNVAAFNVRASNGRGKPVVMSVAEATIWFLPQVPARVLTALVLTLPIESVTSTCTVYVPPGTSATNVGCASVAEFNAALLLAGLS